MEQSGGKPHEVLTTRSWVLLRRNIQNPQLLVDSGLEGAPDLGISVTVPNRWMEATKKYKKGTVAENKERTKLRWPIKELMLCYRVLFWLWLRGLGGRDFLVVKTAPSR